MPRVIKIAAYPYFPSIFLAEISTSLFNIAEEPRPIKYPMTEDKITEIKDSKKPLSIPRIAPFEYIMMLDGTGKMMSETRIIKLNEA